MNKIRAGLLLLLAIWASPAFAQWQVPNHATPQGRGPGITGFRSFGPCQSNVPHVGQGSSADSACWPGNALGTSPSATTDIPNKAYVDALATGLHVLASSTYATAAVLPNSPTYANGASGVGATLTAGSNTTLTVDGVVAALNDVVLVKNQASTFQNGIYKVTTVGSGAAAWVLTRQTYFDQAAEMVAGSYTVITSGASNAGTAWVLQTSVATVGTDALTFNLFGNGIGLTRRASIDRGGTAQTWVPPNPTVYHLFTGLAAPVNDNNFFVANAFTGAAFVPPTGAHLIQLYAQMWITSGASITGTPSIVTKWYKNATVDGNFNILTGQQICTGIGSQSTNGAGTVVMRADCIDVPQPGDYYNVFIYADSNNPGVATIVLDGNPAHTFVQAFVPY